MEIERHAATLEGVRLVNAAPSFQFPTGVVMSEERRRALLQWAYAHDGCVVEDDFDCEHRFWSAELAVAEVDGSLWAGDPCEQLCAVDVSGVAVGVSADAAAVAGEVSGSEVVGGSGECVDAAAGVGDVYWKWAVPRGSAEEWASVGGKASGVGWGGRGRLGDAVEASGSVAGGTLFVRLPGMLRGATGALMAEALVRGVRIRSAERFHRIPSNHVTLVLNYASVSEANLTRAGERLAEAYLTVKKKEAPP